MGKRKEHSLLNTREPELSRRQFLQRLAGMTTTSAAIMGGYYWGYSDQPIRHPNKIIRPWPTYQVASSNLYPTMAIVRGNNVEAMVHESVQKLGGMGRFIQRGDTVLLKPNVGWDRQPEQAANTGPEMVSAVVRLCREAGASKIVVTDVSLNDPTRCFARSGIEEATLKAGGEIRIPGKEDFMNTDMKGHLLKEWPVSKYFHQANKVINLPIVKHHSLCGCTLSMKNWYGVIGGRRNQLHQNIHTSIVDLANAVRPTLSIMDASRVLKQNGPTGGSLLDVTKENTVIASLDEVALDSYCLHFLDLVAENVPFLNLAEKRGLGVVDWKSLNVVESMLG